MKSEVQLCKHGKIQHFILLDELLGIRLQLNKE